MSSLVTRVVKNALSDAEDILREKLQQEEFDILCKTAIGMHALSKGGYEAAKTYVNEFLQLISVFNVEIPKEHETQKVEEFFQKLNTDPQYKNQLGKLFAKSYQGESKPYQALKEKRVQVFEEIKHTEEHTGYRIKEIDIRIEQLKLSRKSSIKNYADELKKMKTIIDLEKKTKQLELDQLKNKIKHLKSPEMLNLEEILKCSTEEDWKKYLEDARDPKNPNKERTFIFLESMKKQIETDTLKRLNQASLFSGSTLLEWTKYYSGGYSDLLLMSLSDIKKWAEKEKLKQEKEDANKVIKDEDILPTNENIPKAYRIGLQVLNRDLESLEMKGKAIDNQFNALENSQKIPDKTQEFKGNIIGLIATTSLFRNFKNEDEGIEAQLKELETEKSSLQEELLKLKEQPKIIGEQMKTMKLNEEFVYTTDQFKKFSTHFQEKILNDILKNPQLLQNIDEKVFTFLMITHKIFDEVESMLVQKTILNIGMKLQNELDSSAKEKKSETSKSSIVTAGIEHYINKNLKDDKQYLAVLQKIIIDQNKKLLKNNNPEDPDKIKLPDFVVSSLTAIDLLRQAMSSASNNSNQNDIMDNLNLRLDQSIRVLKNEVLFSITDIFKKVNNTLENLSSLEKFQEHFPTLKKYIETCGAYNKMLLEIEAEENSIKLDANLPLIIKERKLRDLYEIKKYPLCLKIQKIMTKLSNKVIAVEPPDKAANEMYEHLISLMGLTRWSLKTEVDSIHSKVKVLEIAQQKIRSKLDELKQNPQIGQDQSSLKKLISDLNLEIEGTKYFTDKLNVSRNAVDNCCTKLNKKILENLLTELKEKRASNDTISVKTEKEKNKKKEISIAEQTYMLEKESTNEFVQTTLYNGSQSIMFNQLCTVALGIRNLELRGYPHAEDFSNKFYQQFYKFLPIGTPGRSDQSLFFEFLQKDEKFKEQLMKSFMQTKKLYTSPEITDANVRLDEINLKIDQLNDDLLDLELSRETSLNFKQAKQQCEIELRKNKREIDKLETALLMKVTIKIEDLNEMVKSTKAGDFQEFIKREREQWIQVIKDSYTGAIEQNPLCQSEEFKNDCEKLKALRLERLKLQDMVSDTVSAESSNTHKETWRRNYMEQIQKKQVRLSSDDFSKRKDELTQSLALEEKAKHFYNSKVEKLYAKEHYHQTHKIFDGLKNEFDNKIFSVAMEDVNFVNKVDSETLSFLIASEKTLNSADSLIQETDIINIMKEYNEKYEGEQFTSLQKMLLRKLIESRSEKLKIDELYLKTLSHSLPGFAHTAPIQDLQIFSIPQPKETSQSLRTEMGIVDKIKASFSSPLELLWKTFMYTQNAENFTMALQKQLDNTLPALKNEVMNIIIKIFEKTHQSLKELKTVYTSSDLKNAVKEMDTIAKEINDNQQKINQFNSSRESDKSKLEMYLAERTQLARKSQQLMLTYSKKFAKSDNVQLKQIMLVSNWILQSKVEDFDNRIAGIYSVYENFKPKITELLKTSPKQIMSQLESLNIDVAAANMIKDKLEDSIEIVDIVGKKVTEEIKPLQSWWRRMVNAVTEFMSDIFKSKPTVQKPKGNIEPILIKPNEHNRTKDNANSTKSPDLKPETSTEPDTSPLVFSNTSRKEKLVSIPNLTNKPLGNKNSNEDIDGSHHVHDEKKPKFHN